MLETDSSKEMKKSGKKKKIVKRKKNTLKYVQKVFIQTFQTFCSCLLGQKLGYQKC